MYDILSILKVKIFIIFLSIICVLVHLGSNFTTRCLVFVPGVGIPLVEVLWWNGKHLIFTTDPSERIYTSKQFVPFILSGIHKTTYRVYVIV